VGNHSRPKLVSSALVVVLLVCSALGVATGCTSRREGPEKKTLVRFSFWGSFLELKLWEEMKALYEKRYPDVSLRLEYTPGEYLRKLRLQFISGTACDIIMVDDEFYPTYQESGNLEDLKEYIARDKDAFNFDDFWKTSLESFTYKKKQCALPWDGFSTLMFYNCDLFDKAGVPYPNDDWTWEDFKRLAIQLTKDFDNDGRIDQFGCNVVFSWLGLESVVWSFGGQILTPDKKRFAMNSRKTIAALQYIYDLKYKYHTMPQAGELSGMMGEIQLLTGRVAMLPGGAFAVSTMRGVEAMRWDVAHMPTGPAGKSTRVSWDGLAIYSRSKHKEKAWQFIKLVLSDEGQRLIGSLQRAVPVRKSAAYATFVNPQTPQKEEKFLEAMEYGRLTPITVKYAEMDIVMRNELDKLSLGVTDPATMVRTLEPQINRILSGKGS